MFFTIIGWNYTFAQKTPAMSLANIFTLFKIKTEYYFVETLLSPKLLIFSEYSLNYLPLYYESSRKKNRSSEI
jgi:hypothetical protein